MRLLVFSLIASFIVVASAAPVSAQPMSEEKKAEIKRAAKKRAALKKAQRPGETRKAEAPSTAAPPAPQRIEDERGYSFEIPVGNTATVKGPGWVVSPSTVVVLPLTARDRAELLKQLGPGVGPLTPLDRPGYFRADATVESGGVTSTMKVVAVIKEDFGSIVFMVTTEPAYEAALSMASSLRWTPPLPGAAPGESPRTTALRRRVAGRIVQYNFSARSHMVYALCPDGTFAASGSSNLGLVQQNFVSGTTTILSDVSKDEDRGRWSVVERDGKPTLRLEGEQEVVVFVPAAYQQVEDILTTERLYIEREPGSKSVANLEFLDSAHCQ